MLQPFHAPPSCDYAPLANRLGAATASISCAAVAVRNLLSKRYMHPEHAAVSLLQVCQKPYERYRLGSKVGSTHAQPGHAELLQQSGRLSADVCFYWLQHCTSCTHVTASHPLACSTVLLASCPSPTVCPAQDYNRAACDCSTPGVSHRACSTH
jgi:hypothetical protein